ncbi:hypothetical protein IE53DRAFT_393023 [Violaceomyces palustris]|uniref:Uncharacterized protein n=1 Tax=Violaceomyces palustris TaxID=1673888 RepID=A0ACD0P0U6_9BASI|nr:hypothetical protein IE53DRAFT_393023 [Violaceomyces palustris]
MPRKIPSQVPQTVSRLLGSGFLKTPPAWFEAVNQHPPAPTPPRHQVRRPDDDLPSYLRSAAKEKLKPLPFIARPSTTKPKTKQTSSSSSTPPSSPSSPSTSTSSSSIAHKTKPRQHQRDPKNSKKKVKALAPSLAPRPIVYAEDSIRAQFFRDHPWEAYRPKLLVEMNETVSERPQLEGEAWLMRSYGRNPSVEDFIACTLAAHKQGKLSLSQAYHNTLSAYHALRAEREHMIRYANLEARAYGADMGKTQTERGFDKEEKALATWNESLVKAMGGSGSSETLSPSSDNSATKAPRVKRQDQDFTGGERYLDGALSLSRGTLNEAETTSNLEAGSQVDKAKHEHLFNDPSDDFMGIASKKPSAAARG